VSIVCAASIPVSADVNANSKNILMFNSIPLSGDCGSERAVVVWSFACPSVGIGTAHAVCGTP